MDIGFAREGDIPKILDLLTQVELVHYQIRPDIFRNGGQKYDAPALKALLADPIRPIFAAREGGKLLGYAFCILKEIRNDPVLLDQKTLYIDDLCVDESCRGQGIASALYDWVCAFAREQGCQSVTLNVWEGNDSARRFYENKGLKPQKTIMEFTL